MVGEVVPLLDLIQGYNADEDDDDTTDNNDSDNGNGTMGNNLDNDGDGTTGDDVDHDGDGAAYDDIDDDCNGATGDKVDDDGDGTKLLSPSMCRRLRRCCDSVAPLVVMASLPSPMRMRLAVVNDDGDGVTGDNYDDFDDATDFAIVVMALLPSSRWRCCHCQCAGVLPLSTMMATVQRATKSTMMAMARRATNDFDGATGDEVDDNSDGVTGYDVNDNDGTSTSTTTPA